MSGFVYIWYDKKKKMYYIGSHWGAEDDGYICSSNWMYKTYKRRPHDFKRRILSTITTNRLDLLDEEQKWLTKIKRKKQYYNICFITKKSSIQRYWLNKIRPEETKQKMRDAQLKLHATGYHPRLGTKHSVESKEKMRQAKLKHTPWNKGIPHTTEHKQNLKLAWQQRKKRLVK